MSKAFIETVEHLRDAVVGDMWRIIYTNGTMRETSDPSEAQLLLQQDHFLEQSKSLLHDTDNPTAQARKHLRLVGGDPLPTTGLLPHQKGRLRDKVLGGATFGDTNKVDR